MNSPIISEQDVNVKSIKQAISEINPKKLPPDLLRELTQFLVSFNKKVKDHEQKRNVVRAFFIIGFFFAFSHMIAQCASPPAFPSCSAPGVTALGNNDVIAAGQIKAVTASQVYNSLTVSGGTLVVCSTLTLSTLNFSGGKIYIHPGASVYINTNSSIAFSANSSIYNAGNFTSSGSIVTGQNNVIFNTTGGSSFNVLFNQLVIQGYNTTLINNGIINTGYFIVSSSNSPGVICSGIGTAINTNIIINQYANAFLSPAGISCVGITGQIINSQPMTATSNVNVCYMASSVTVSGSPNFGAATVNSECPSCSKLLPVEMTRLSGYCEEDVVHLSWSTLTEKNNASFTIERSENGLSFVVLATVPGSGSSMTAKSYSWSFPGNGEEISYYRLKQSDHSGGISYSPILDVACSSKEQISIYQDVQADNVFTVMYSPGIHLIEVHDVLGRSLNLLSGNRKSAETVSLSDLPPGLYILSVQASNNKVMNTKIFVN